MFFKNIKSWSKKRMWVATICSYFIYSCLLVIAPMITILIKYKCFGGGTKTTGINGLGLIVIGVFTIYAYIMMRKLFKKLPEVTPMEQRFKFGLETFMNLLPFGVALFFIFVSKDNVNLAFSTAKWLILWSALATLFDGLFVKFIDAEWTIRNGAKFDKAKKEREGVV